MTDLIDFNTWSSDDLADRPDVLAALIDVAEEASCLVVTRPDHWTFEDNLSRLRQKANAVYGIARQTPAGR